MLRLVISKIEARECETHLECELLDCEVYDFPLEITLLGQCFIKMGWNSDRRVVYYKARK